MNFNLFNFNKIIDNIEENGVKTVDEKRKILAIIFIFIIFGINLIIATRIFQYVKLVELKYTTSKLKKIEKNINSELEKLKLEKASLNSLSRIEKIANEKLKMIKNKKNIIYYDTNS